FAGALVWAAAKFVAAKHKDAASKSAEFFCMVASYIRYHILHRFALHPFGAAAQPWGPRKGQSRWCATLGRTSRGPAPLRHRPRRAGLSGPEPTAAFSPRR